MKQLTMFNTLTFGLIQAIRKKTAGLHMVLNRNISALAEVTHLVKVSKDAASLVVCTRKNIVWLGDTVFL